MFLIDFETLDKILEKRLPKEIVKIIFSYYDIKCIICSNMLDICAYCYVNTYDLFNSYRRCNCAGNIIALYSNECFTCPLSLCETREINL